MSLLLDERGVDFGDRFSRDAVDAFAMDDELQCMAYSVSPMVIYYNTDIVDFDKMERRQIDVPTADDGSSATVIVCVPGVGQTQLSSTSRSLKPVCATVVWKAPSIETSPTPPAW